ncbi:hemagglutinin repeat-containing protein [Candidatus Deianiraea vastatrix]|uniref:Adhesin/hemagglutinin-related protein n=1 Tax=Candidatus Deianiraea vastatrix TaxID=2163644 RepID=A0A5B8XCT7_9RICK|nr:hemagglutinin repeat-containing protein [Candidatus Deianiraea vastatrix]QED23050.1 Putative adhesin/hemagglutinin-related protein [Candidatus Deianiraea vastatrix]
MKYSIHTNISPDYVTLAIGGAVAGSLSAGTSAPAFGFYGYGSLTVESSSAKSTNTTTNEVQNQILAGNLIDLTAVADANIYGSQLVSGNNINITAQNLTLEASKNNQTSGSSSVYDSVTGTAKTTGTFGGSFTHAESGSSLTSTTNVASNIASDNVNINTSGDTNVLGSNIAGVNSVLLNAQNLNVTTLQDVLSSSSESHSYTFGTDIGFSISSSSHDKLWAGTQAGITSGDALNITVADNTNLTGSLLNSQTGNLNLATNTLTHSDLQQSEKDWNYAYSLGMSFSVGSGTANGGSGNGQSSAGQGVSGQTGVYNTGAGSTTIGFSNSGFEKEGVAKATVGEGNITTTSNVDGLNRDETQSMLVTKNERTGGLDGNITIDNSMLTDLVTAMSTGNWEYKDTGRKDENGNPIMEKMYWKSVADGLDVIGNADEKLQDYTKTNHLNYGIGGNAVTKSKDPDTQEIADNANAGRNQIGIGNSNDGGVIGKEVGISDIGWSGKQFTNEGGLMSTIVSMIPGMKSMAVFHDGWTGNNFKDNNTSEGAYKTGMTMASIIPAIMINYYALALHTIKSPVATYQSTFSSSTTVSSSQNAQNP